MEFEKINAWVTAIQERLTVQLVNMEEDEIDELLDARDADPFDSEWVAAQQALQEHIEVLTRKEQQSVEDFEGKMRKDTYMKVIRESGSADLAAYVSDDIGMIVMAFGSRFTNTFIFSLANSYATGVIPDHSMAQHLENPIGLY